MPDISFMSLSVYDNLKEVVDLEYRETKLFVFKEEKKSDKDKIKRYKRTILKLSEMAKISTPKPKNAPASQRREVSQVNSEMDAEKEKTAVVSQKSKCKYENGGKCKEKESCEYFHPKRTCQTYSKLGSCPVGNQCNRRHPKIICREWEVNHNCQWNDRCRFRHPLEKIQKNFLGVRPPVPKESQQQQQIPKQTLQPPTNQNFQGFPLSQLMKSTVTPLNNPQYDLHFPPLFSFPPPQLTERWRRQ